MTDYEYVQAITNARLFLRNYIYDEETLFIFETYLKNNIGVESISYHDNAKMYTIATSEIIKGNYDITPEVKILQSYEQFLTHPDIAKKIKLLDHFTDENVIKIISQSTYDMGITRLLIDINELTNDNNYNLSFVIRL